MSLSRAHRILKILKNPGFWIIVVVLALITLPHYWVSLPYPSFLDRFISDLGITRYTFERILFLAPIVWASFFFGWKGAFFTSIAALACMMPRIIFLDEQPWDSLFAAGAVFVVGNVLSISVNSLRREREYRKQLETAQLELKKSEERYRQLFENAHDSIWIHDLDGSFLTVNRATEKLTGYSGFELCRMNVKTFLSRDSLELAQTIRKKILNNEAVDQPYEQKIFRRDGSEIIIQITTSPVLENGKPVAFQHIARDITEQKRMEQNLRFYLRQATRAQEEERKRISHELHDDTIQSLIVLSRQLDALASNNKDVPEETRQHLEKLWQQTDSILQGVRRLSQDLRPAAIDRLGLLPAVEWLASEVTKQASVATKVLVVGKEHRLPEEVAIALFRIIQEALNNIRKHSGATRSAIIIEFSDKRTKVTISDNGKGFDLPNKVGDLAKHGKLGLAGMQERAQLVGGTISVKSGPKKGTTIVVEAPG